MIYDIAIIGAATSGAYFAKKMAKKGFKVKMIEKLDEKTLGTRMDIFHVSQTDLKTYDMPTVKEGDPAWAFEFTENHFSSPSNRYKVDTVAETVGLHMHEYVALMVKRALEAGAEIEYSAAFKSFIYDNGKICGINYTTPDGEKKIYAKTVVDCSGAAAVGRRALPLGYGVETFRLADDEMFYVVLRYAEFDAPQINNFWLNMKSWTAPFSMDSRQKILGTGAVNGYKNAEAIFPKLDKVGTDGPFRIVKTEKGTTPYRRPPYSLVADNFIVAGDAACLTKPDCGEGVTSSMVMMDIAADVLEKALRNGDTSKKALWKINTEYNKKQGADFCLVRAFLTKVIKAKDEEIEYCFSQKLIFNGKFLNGEKLTAKDIVDTVGGVISAAAKKNVSSATLKGVLEGAKLGIALRQHYMNFSDDPEKLHAWTVKADKLWKKVGKVE